jgi:hypothetical protein
MKNEPRPHAICPRCEHYREPVRIRLFSDIEGGAHPGEVQGRLRWSAHLVNQALRERAEVEDKGTLPWKPRESPWCALYTLDEQEAESATERLRDGDFTVLDTLKEGARAFNFDPVAALIEPRYVLCLTANPKGFCDGYKSSVADGKPPHPG